MMTMSKLLLLCAIAGCATSTADSAKDPTVELSAVTLSDDCTPPPPPSTKVPAQPPATPAVPAKVAPGGGAPAAARCAGPGCGRRCEQTSMQLSIKVPAGAKPTTLKIVKVELLDDKGKLLETLASYTPRMWT